MRKIKKILIALDYEPSAQRVAEIGQEIAKGLYAKVILLHIIADVVYYTSTEYPPIMGFDGFNDTYIPPLNNNESLKKDAQIFLNKTKEHLKDESIQTIIKDGNFAEEIVNTATDMNANMIIMGSHNRRGLDKLLLGSVAEKVLHLSSIPVLIIPTNEQK